MDEAMKGLVQEAVYGEVFGVWFLIGAALVFWMQAGFAMVEAGFTRAKKYRKYHYEELDGFLYWNRSIYTYWFWFSDGRRPVWIYRKAGI